VCVVLAGPAGYPGTVRSGDVIHGMENCPATVFQAGNKLTKNGLETGRGRVLGVTSSGPDLAAGHPYNIEGGGRIHF